MQRFLVEAYNSNSVERAVSITRLLCTTHVWRVLSNNVRSFPARNYSSMSTTRARFVT